jgi:hypothetical protein
LAQRDCGDTFWGIDADAATRAAAAAVVAAREAAAAAAVAAARAAAVAEAHRAEVARGGARAMVERAAASDAAAAAARADYIDAFRWGACPLVACMLFSLTCDTMLVRAHTRAHVHTRSCAIAHKH